jgi:hypothetical protein
MGFVLGSASYNNVTEAENTSRTVGGSETSKLMTGILGGTPGHTGGQITIQADTVDLLS